MLAQVEALQRQWLDDKLVEGLADFIFVDWPRWFSLHVNSMDMVTAEFASRLVTQ